MRTLVGYSAAALTVLSIVILAYKAWRTEGNGWGLAVLFVPLVWLYYLVSRPSRHGAISLICRLAALALTATATYLM